MSGVRRRLLAAIAQAAATPVTVGNTGTFTTVNALLTQRTLVDTGDPANATGTVVTVSMYVTMPGTFYIHTGSLSGTTYTVRAVTSALTIGSGAQTVTVSLAVNAGDRIGYTSLNGGNLAGSLGGTAGKTTGANTVNAIPTAGGTLTLSNAANTQISILGTNP